MSLGLTLTFGTSALSGQGTDGERTGNALLLDPIVVIGTAENARLLTGSALVIDAQELKRFQYSNVHSVLRTAPGVYIREEDGLGTFPRIGIRASSSGRSDRISIMEDGVPAAMAPYANTSAYYFPAVGRMSGVEILKGPEIMRFGPQTTSGAVNLLSTPIPDEPRGFVGVENGAWSSRRIHTWAGGTFGSFGALLETYQNQTDGFHRIDRSNRSSGNDISDYMLKLRWSSSPEQSLRQQVDLKLFHGDEVADVSYLGLTDADFRADPDRRYGLAERERMNRGRESVSLRYRVDFSSALTLIATGYATDTHRNYTRLNQINGLAIGGSGITSQVNNGASNAALLQGILDGTANSTHANGVRYGNNFQSFEVRGLQLEAHAAVRTGPILHEILGGVRRHEDTALNTVVQNVMYNQVNGSLVFSSATEATAHEGFAKATSFWLADRIRLSDLTLLPLLRYESVESRADVAVPTSARNELTKTTLGFGANYGAGESWTFLAGVHQGFAPPGSNATEGSRGEESTNIEGGVRFRSGRVGMDLVAFHTDYSNALRNCLVANPCANGATDGVQQDGAKKVSGVETNVSALIARREGLEFPLHLAYTYTDGEYTRGADVASGVREGDILDHTPKHIGRATIGVEHEAGRTLSIAFNYGSGVCVTTTCGREGVDTRFLETDNLFTIDLAASFRLGSAVDLYARVENIFDERKITHRGADGARGNPARFLGTGLRVNF